MWVTENGLHRGSTTEMSLEGWTGVCLANAEDSLDNLREYSCIF